MEAAVCVYFFAVQIHGSLRPGKKLLKKLFSFQFRDFHGEKQRSEQSGGKSLLKRREVW